MIEGEAALAALLIRVFGLEAPPKPLHLVQPAIRAVTGEITLAEAAKIAGTTRSRMERIVVSPNPVRAIIGGEIPALTLEAERSARQSLGQLLIGNLAERAFEQIYESTVGTTELELRDDRGRRGETDYLVFNGQGRQVFRLNIKFHGSQFRRAQELVGLRPEDCFALATYKIHAALRRQESEHLPYIFVIVGVPGLTGASGGMNLPSNLVHLAALPRLMRAVTGVRQLEDRIVDTLAATPREFDLHEVIEGYSNLIRNAEWYVLSARRADKLLRDMLFERAYALRVRAFARNYSGAELDMHFSLSGDLSPLTRFLEVLRDDGMPGLVSRLERGTF